MATGNPVVTVLTHRADWRPPGLEPLARQARVRFAHDADSLRKTLPGTDVLLVTCLRTGALQQLWPLAEGIRWIHTTSAGVDAVLFPGVQASDVIVTNARGIFDHAIAEYVLGVILAFAKDTRRNIELQQTQTWQHRNTERILDKRLLVVGAGAIGRRIARLCHAAGLHVEGIARSARDQDPDFAAVHATADLNTQLPRFDYVTTCLPLTAETRGLFGRAQFAAMQPHARFINVGRGPLVETDALVAALQHREIAGAGLDVFEQEPLPAGHPLWGMDNVLISAHMAGDFHGWREALTEQFLTNFQRWRNGETLHNIVDKQRGYVPPG